MTRIEISDGKYTIIHDNGRDLRALRYGEEWRDLVGDNLVMAMAQEIEDLRERVENAEEQLRRGKRTRNDISDDYLYAQGGYLSI